MFKRHLNDSGKKQTVTANAYDIAHAEKVVLPGVGAFRDAIAEIRRRDLVGPIRDSIDSGKPALGICLGLQLLFDVSYEDGEWEGLGIVPGKVVKFDLGDEYKVPHMGWNQAKVLRQAPAIDGIADGSHFYFVHSYHVVPEDRSVVALETNYGHNFCSAIWRDNLFATQFHPEKSQANGLRLLQNFATGATCGLCST